MATANLVLQDTIERIFIEDIYADISRGIFLVRGENVLLLGEIVRSIPPTSPCEIHSPARAHLDGSQKNRISIRTITSPNPTAKPPQKRSTPSPWKGTRTPGDRTRSGRRSYRRWASRRNTAGRFYFDARGPAFLVFSIPLGYDRRRCLPTEKVFNRGGPRRAEAEYCEMLSAGKQGQSSTLFDVASVIPFLGKGLISLMPVRVVRFSMFICFLPRCDYGIEGVSVWFNR